MTEDEMVGWHHQLNGCEFEQALGDGEGQGSLMCCSPWGQTQLSELDSNNDTLCPKLLECVLGLKHYHHSDSGKVVINFCSYA